MAYVFADDPITAIRAKTQRVLMQKLWTSGKGAFTLPRIDALTVNLNICRLDHGVGFKRVLGQKRRKI